MRTKINTKKQIRNLLFVPLLIAGLVCTSLPSSAASTKAIVDDVDKDGKISIGDTFCLGSECFYVTANKDGQVKALAKYNLYVGANYDKITPDITKTYMKEACTENNISNCWKDNEGSKFYIDGTEVSSADVWKESFLNKYHLNKITDEIENKDSDGTIAYYTKLSSGVYEEDGKYYNDSTYKLYPYTTITSSTKGYALQNSLAVGVNGEKGNATYPIYATSLMFNDDHRLSYYIKDGSLENFTNGYTNFEYTDNSDVNVSKYLRDYSAKLANMGYTTSSVNLITVSELDDLIHSISSKNLPLGEWFDNSNGKVENDDGLSNYATIGDLKPYVSEDYAWIWNTSYWTRTIVGNGVNLDNWAMGSTDVYFVSSAGDICYSASGCWSGIPRAGIRPIITMAENDLMLNELFSINGTVKWIDNNNSSKIRPNKSVIKLYRNGVLVASTNVVATDDPDLWKFSFANLAKYDANGKEYVYTITQDNVPMYSSDITNFDVVNQYAPNPKTADGIGHWAPMLGGGAIVITAGAIAFGRRRH